MNTSRRIIIVLTIIVIAWYLGLSNLAQIMGTCLDGACGLSTGEVVVSLAIPLAFFALPMMLEVILYRKRLPAALSNIGLTRFSLTGVRLAAIILTLLIAFFSPFSPLTQSPLSLQLTWLWLLLSVMLNNGLAEETVMRRFVFRHLCEGRPFWRAATLSTLCFAGYHLPLIFTTGPMIGIIGVALAIPTGFVTAYIYERGNNTLWGTALFHTVYNSLILVVAFATQLQPVPISLYLASAIAMAIILVTWAYRHQHYERREARAIHEADLQAVWKESCRA